MIRQELVDIVLGHENRRNFHGFRSPARCCLHNLRQERDHVVALGIAVLPGGGRHEPLLDVLERLRVAVDAKDLYVVAILSPERADRSDRGIIPASPDREVLLAGWVRGEPGVGVLGAVFEIGGNTDFILGELDVV
jgi:hypothetical protein